jgi:hypothetical protein
MNLILEIRTFQKRNFKSSSLNLSSLSSVILNEPMNLGASSTFTLKYCKPHIGDTLRYTKSSKFNPLRLMSALLFCLDCSICRFSLTTQTCLSASCNMSGPKKICSLVSFQNNGVGYLHPYCIVNDAIFKLP